MQRLIDLTRPLTDRVLSYPGDRLAIALGRADSDDPRSRVCWLGHLDLHAGTHMDAPCHFVPGGADIASVGPMFLPAVVVRCRAVRILAEALPAGPLRGRAVLFDTGWTHGPESPEYFRGFPHLSAEAAKELVKRGAALVGIDTPSVDSADETVDFPAHRALLTAGIPIVEGLTRLGELPGGGDVVWFAAFPLSIQEADGAPARAVALLDMAESRSSAAETTSRRPEG